MTFMDVEILKQLSKLSSLLFYAGSEDEIHAVRLGSKFFSH